MPDATPKADVIVVGYDGSPGSRTAVELAIDHAARRGSRLVIAHAGEDGHVLDDLRAQMGERLAGLEWQCRALPGTAPGVLERIADEEGAGELVVGSGRRGRTGGVLGSTVERLLAHGDHAVTVVPEGVVVPTGGG